MTLGYPHNWFWIVGDNDTRAWSIAAGAYTADFDATRVTRIGTEASLDAVLRALGAASPRKSVDDVRAEASRRMQMLVGAREDADLEIKIANASREAIRLLRKGSENWTAEEATRAAQLEAIDGMIEEIRAASNVLEAMDPVPDDFAADSRWPAI